MHTSSNLNLLRRGGHFGSIFVHHDGRHGGLTNRNAFYQEHGRIELCGLCQRPAKCVYVNNMKLANGSNLNPNFGYLNLNPNPSVLTLKRRLKKLPWVSASWIQSSWLGKASYWNPRPWHKLLLICQFQPAMWHEWDVHHCRNAHYALLGEQALLFTTTVCEFIIFLQFELIANWSRWLDFKEKRQLTLSTTRTVTSRMLEMCTVAEAGVWKARHKSWTITFTVPGWTVETWAHTHRVKVSGLDHGGQTYLQAVGQNPQEWHWMRSSLGPSDVQIVSLTCTVLLASWNSTFVTPFTLVLTKK